MSNDPGHLAVYGVVTLHSGEFFGSKKRACLGENFGLSVHWYEPFSSQPQHSHANLTLFLQVSGDHLDCVGSGQAYQAPLSVNLHPASVTHHSEVGPSGMSGVNIEISSEWLARHELTEEDLGPARIMSHPVLRCRAARFLALAFGGTRTPSDLDASLLELIEPFAEEIDSSQIGAQPWIGRVHEAILSRYAEPLSVAQLASEARVHPVHLTRSFKNRYGYTVSELLHYVRMSEACQAICSGESVGSAAIEAGFYDQFHLSNFLARKFGFRPNQLKKAVSA